MTRNEREQVEKHFDELNEKTEITLPTEIRQAIKAAYMAGADYAIDMFATRWISVEDELPPNNGSGFSNEVLAYDSMYYRWMITSYDYRCNLWLMCERVTHWMPLPQPPKKGGEQ